MRLPWGRRKLQAAAAGDQVEDEDNDGDDQQNVDQAAGNVKAEAEEPQDDEDDEYGPKHDRLPLIRRAPRSNYCSRRRRLAEKTVGV